MGALPLSKPTAKPSGCFLAGLLRVGTSMPGWVPGTEQPPCLHSGAMSDCCHAGGLPPTQPSLPQPYTPTRAQGGWYHPAQCSSSQAVESSSCFRVYLTLPTTPQLPQPRHSTVAVGPPSHTPTPRWVLGLAQHVCPISTPTVTVPWPRHPPAPVPACRRQPPSLASAPVVLLSSLGQFGISAAQPCPLLHISTAQDGQSHWLLGSEGQPGHGWDGE